MSSKRRRGRPRKGVSAEDRARGVTDQDLDDLEFGIRCVLHTPGYIIKDPFSSFRETVRFTFKVRNSQIFEPHRGYAPESIARDYVYERYSLPDGHRRWDYKWTRRDKGIHHYDYVRRQYTDLHERIVLRAPSGRTYDAWITGPHRWYNMQYAQDDLY